MELITREDPGEKNAYNSCYMFFCEYLSQSSGAIDGQLLWQMFVDCIKN